VENSEAVVTQFDYRPPRLQAIGLFLLAFSGAMLLTYFAIFLDRPVNVLGFSLSPSRGRIVFGVFATLSPIGLFPLAAMIYIAFAYDRRVALTETHVILPKPTRMGLSRDEILIPLDSIVSATVRPFIGTTHTLRFETADGTVVNIPSNMFRSRVEFNHFCHEIQQALRMI
jgi:hypothetical protein